MTDRNKLLEQIAESWDGCMYDAVGETLDIGAQLRKQFAALLSAQQAQCQTEFPAKIYDLLREVASRTPPEGRGVWEDEKGQPMQDDADAALAWIHAQQAQPTGFKEHLDKCSNIVQSWPAWKQEQPSDELAGLRKQNADIHSCSYYCERPDCVRKQRDELRRMYVEHPTEQCQRDKNNIGELSSDDVVTFGTSLLGFASETEALGTHESEEWVRGHLNKWLSDRAPATSECDHGSGVL